MIRPFVVAFAAIALGAAATGAAMALAAVIGSALSVMGVPF